MHQTHSNKVVVVTENNFKKIKGPMLTKMKGVAIGVVTADCVYFI